MNEINDKIMRFENIAHKNFVTSFNKNINIKISDEINILIWDQIGTQFETVLMNNMFFLKKI